jgi:Tfp pilus assembly PilM family ATPase
MSLLSKQTIGIDISDRSIEVVCVEKKARGISVVSAARTELPTGIVADGCITNEIELTKLFLEVLVKAGIDKQESRLCIFGIPARFTYLRTVEAPEEKNSVQKAINEDLTRSVPLDDKNRLVVSKSVLGDSKKNWIFVMATDKSVVEQWNRFLLKCGLKNIQFASELLATGVGLKDQTKSAPFCLLDLGAGTTKIGFFY